MAKVWDTVAGTPLVSLTHEHIVRTVDLSLDEKRLLTGGNEKKLRIWDLNRGEVGTEGATELKMEGGGTSHQGTVRSACWDEIRGSIISMGEDRVVRFVLPPVAVVQADAGQMVGSEDAAANAFGHV